MNSQTIPINRTLTQTIYINLDDSGKLSKKEKISVYGGVIFFSKEEKDKFITQYRSIISTLKCNYCSHCDHCTNQCPELKSHNLTSKDNRRILNYIKKYFVAACIIQNDQIYDHILENKASKGRFTDYALRRVIKEIIKLLIEEKKINPNQPVHLILNIDEQSTKSNGYYNLKDGLLEELKYGILNFNYCTLHEPILFNDLEIELTYQKSETSYVVQAADLIAGYVRKKSLQFQENLTKMEQSLSFIDYKLFLP